MKDSDVQTLVSYRLAEARTALEDAAYLREGRRSQQSIINRLYYAMFYAAVALLQQAGKVPSKHTGVISLFDSGFVLKGRLPKEMSKSFHRAFELRQVSDYRVSQPVRAEDVEELHRQAVEFVKRVEAYIKQVGGRAAGQTGGCQARGKDGS